MKNTETYLQFKKYDLFTQDWLSAQDSKSNLLIVHGLGEHSSCYNHMAEYLCEHGISCHSFDLIGHGQSSGQRGYIPNFDLFVEQLIYILTNLKSRFEGSKFSIFSHSMGGLISLKALKDKLIVEDTPLIFSNPLVKINVEVPEWKLTLAYKLSQFLPRLTLGNEINNNDLTKDQKVIEMYTTDPLRHNKISSKLFVEIQETISQVNRQLIKIKNPSLFLLSPNDKVCDANETQVLMKEFINSQLELFPQSGHEIVNDLSKYKAFDDIVTFIKEAN